MKDARAPNLRGIPLFSGLPSGARRYLQSRLRRFNFPAGTCIIQHGAHGHFMAMIGKGQVALTNQFGQTQVLHAGESFGEGMLRYDVPSSFTATAQEETTLWVLLRQDWLAIHQQAVEGTPASTKPRGKNRQGRRWGSAVLVAIVIVLLFLGPNLLDLTNRNITQWAMDAGRPDLAEVYLNFAIPWQPRSAQLYVALGTALYRQGKQAEALVAFQYAADLDKSSAVAQNNLGVALYQQAQAEKAIEHLQIAVTLDPGSVEALLNLGNAYLAAGNFTSAAKAYRRAYDLDASQLDALALWAGIVLNTGQVDQAKSAWEEVLVAMPENELAHKGLGAIAVLESDPIQALPHLVAAKEINPRDATVRFYLGLAWEILGRQEEAAVEYEQALALSNDQALLSLVEAHLRALHQP